VVRSLGLSLRRREQEVFLALAGTALAVACVAPLVSLVAREGASWSTAAELLGESRAGALLLRSLGLSFAVTLLALGIGVPLGVVVGRTDARGRSAAWLLHALPAFLPPFLLALGWFHVLGARSPTGSAATSRILFSEAGLVLVLTLAFAPIATSLVALGLQALDPSLEDAARVAAGPFRAVTRILLPAAAPAAALAAIVVFTLAFSELGAPMFLRVDVFPAAVFARLGGIDYAPGEALALVLPLVPLALLLLVAERRLAGVRSYAVLGLRSPRPDRLSLGRARTAASLALWLACLLSVTPIAALAVRALSGGGFAQVGAWISRAPANSLSSAAIAATVMVAIGLVVGHAAARRFPGAALLDAAAVFSFVTPAALLGAGLVGLWNRPGLQWVYATPGILVVGYVARYAVIGVRTIGALVAQAPRHLEEAAATVGAGYARRLGRILVPLHARGIGFAWLLAFAFCLRDLETAVLYYPPGGEPLTVRIFTLEANGPEPLVAALALVHVAITAAVVAGGGLLLRRRSA
jgi:iron(III) transport system permease protein